MDFEYIFNNYGVNGEITYPSGEKKTIKCLVQPKSGEGRTMTPLGETDAERFACFVEGGADLGDCNSAVLSAEGTEYVIISCREYKIAGMTTHLECTLRRKEPEHDGI